MHLPVTLRPATTKACAHKEAATDEDVVGYFLALICVDHRHWVSASHGDNIMTGAVAPFASMKGDVAQFYYRPLVNGEAKPDAPLVRGSMAMCLMLRDAVDRERIRWYDPIFLATHMDTATLRHLCRGAVQADGVTPAAVSGLEERAAMLRTIGQRLWSTDRGWLDVVKAAQGRLLNDGKGFLERLCALSPRYNDSVPLDVLLDDPEKSRGRRLFLCKLAQLSVIVLADIVPALQTPEARAAVTFSDLDAVITVAPDYQLPKALRLWGVLTYSPTLAGYVDGQCMIPPGSREEVELRLASTIAGQMLAKAHGVSVSAVDYALWAAGRARTDVPHHVTPTIMY